MQTGPEDERPTPMEKDEEAALDDLESQLDLDNPEDLEEDDEEYEEDEYEDLEDEEEEEK